VSRQLINEYRAELDRLRAVSGSRREGVRSEAFKDLLRRWGKPNDLVFVSQHGIVTKKGNRIYTDGALLHPLRVPFGYWEAKTRTTISNVRSRPSSAAAICATTSFSAMIGWPCSFRDGSS